MPRVGKRIKGAAQELFRLGGKDLLQREKWGSCPWGFAGTQEVPLCSLSPLHLPEEGGTRVSGFCSCLQRQR